MWWTLFRERMQIRCADHNYSCHEEIGMCATLKGWEFADLVIPAIHISNQNLELNGKLPENRLERRSYNLASQI